MLSIMRKHAGTWLIKIILGAIVIVFVFWGVGSYTSQKSSKVATVNGDAVTLDEYRATYNRLIQQVRQNFGNQVNDDIIKTLQLEKQALDQLVDKILLRQAADNLQFRVSDQELAQSIGNITAFQTDGAFDTRRYQGILGLNNMTPEEFELGQRDTLLVAKLQSFMTDSVKVSDQEALESYKWNNTQVDLAYVLFEAGRYKDISPSAEEIAAHFESNKTSYKTQPKLKARYLSFKADSYASKVEVTDDEIKDYYESNLEDFEMEKTVGARHILIKVAQDADPETVAKAKLKIEEALKLAREGQDFAELAKQYSEGPTKDKGGDLGSFARGAMVKPFADKAFEMKAGEISDPLRTQFGWHIIKVEKVNEANTRSLDEATAEIRKKMVDEQAKNLAFDEAEAAYDAAFEGGNLTAIAETRNLEVQMTDYFTRQGPQQKIKNPDQFAKIAFDLAEKEVSDIQDLGDGFYLLEVVEKMPAQIPELNAVEEKVKNDLIKKKQDEMAKQDAEKLLADMKNGESMAEAGQKHGLKPQNTGLFKRNDSIPNIGYEREMAQIAFSLTEQDSLAQEIIKGRKGYYVVKFSGKELPAPEGFDKEKDDIKTQLLQQKKASIFRDWLTQLKEKSEITIQEGFLES